MFSTMGDIMINVGGYLEYCGGCLVLWRYHEYHGGVQYHGGIPSFEI